MDRTKAANPYDHPRLYDLAFAVGCRTELKFLTASFRKYATIDVRRVFEPACGTGRLLFRLAQAGFAVSGLDLNERAVAFCNDRLRRKGFSATAAIGDMKDFRLPGKVDAAFNLVSSFRHLELDEAAWSHLRCMAAALRLGGIYVIGLHLTPTGRAPSNTELWTVQRGHLRVRTRVLTTSRNLRRRDERLRVTFDVRTPTSKRKLESRIALRMYTADQFLRLLSAVPEFEIAGTHDLHYQIGTPTKLDSRTEDVVFVLRRRRAINGNL